VGRDLLVLCYHAVSERWEADLSIRPERLDRQLELLVSRGYRGATFTEAARDRTAGKTLVVTFDDAYRSVIDLALPVLSRLELPGTVFAPTIFIGVEGPMTWPGIDMWIGGPHEAELTPMTWEELGTLAEQGWEVGSHTRTHPRLTEIDDAALAEELEASRVECEARLGRACESLAYPYGDYDDRVVEATRRAGYSAACTAALHRPFPLRWPRVCVYPVDGEWRFRLKVSPTIRRLRAAQGQPQSRTSPSYSAATRSA
jgi:peptidoglycan/xylan/chitin deacetylase (PgdA/CDA1 family)